MSDDILLQSWDGEKDTVIQDTELTDLIDYAEQWALFVKKDTHAPNVIRTIGFLRHWIKIFQQQSIDNEPPVSDRDRTVCSDCGEQLTILEKEASERYNNILCFGCAIKKKTHKPKSDVESEIDFALKVLSRFSWNFETEKDGKEIAWEDAFRIAMDKTIEQLKNGEDIQEGKDQPIDLFIQYKIARSLLDEENLNIPALKKVMDNLIEQIEKDGRFISIMRDC